MEKMFCPYCHKEIKVDNESLSFSDNGTSLVECPECGKNFIAECSVYYTFSTKKCPCQNEGEHKWFLTNTFPKAFSMMRCAYCDEERELTLEERLKFNIETKEQYFERQKYNHIVLK